MRLSIVLISIIFSVSNLTRAQSINELKNAYSGKIEWNKKSQILTFKTSGNIIFDKEDTCMNYFWMVPETVKQIVLEKNIKVVGAFHTFNDCTIAGKDRKTSIIYGTSERSWANNRKLKAYNYSHILNHKGVLKVENLTMIDPLSYFIRSFNQLLHVSHCNFFDYRGGHHNHSDGISGGDGSTVDNCYFATGDDAIKVYDDITVTNTTIEMVDNCVPIQLGWGNYPDGAVGTFKNLKIIGKSGRYNSDNAIISGRKGKYTVTINIDGLEVENSNAVLVSLWEKGMVLNGEITNCKIDVRAFSDQRQAGTCNLTICGSSVKQNIYNCMD